MGSSGSLRVKYKTIKTKGNRPADIIPPDGFLLISFLCNAFLYKSSRFIYEKGTLKNLIKVLLR